MGKNKTVSTEIVATDIYFTTQGENGILSVKSIKIDDPKLGTKDNTAVGRCKTCLLGLNKCLSHPGSIKLKHYLMKEICISYIIHWLKGVCNKCSAFIASDDKIDRLW